MNFGQKSKHLPIDSKKQTDKTFNLLFKAISSCVSKAKFEEDHHEANKINDQAMEILDRIMELVSERDEKIKIENDMFKNAMESFNSQLQDCMADTLQENMQIAMENLDNWKLLTVKKENFEQMHHNLLQMKRNVLSVKFFRRENR